MMNEKCNHRINSEFSSISLLDDLKTFVFPKKIYGCCKFCGKSFTYILDEKGKLKNYKEDSRC